MTGLGTGPLVKPYAHLPAKLHVELLCGILFKDYSRVRSHVKGSCVLSCNIRMTGLASMTFRKTLLINPYN